jgi:hypothetical protein
MTNTAPGLAVAAIGAAWSAIAGAVPRAWEAIKSAVESAARRVWNAAKEILGKPIEMVVTTVQRTVTDIVQGATGTYTYKPTGSTQPLGTNPTGPDGKKISGPLKPGGSFHTGGIFTPTDGRNEGLALLLSGERVLSPRQTRDYDAGLLDLIRALTRKLDSGGTGGNVIIQGNVGLSADYPYDRLLRDIRRDLAQTRTSRGILS